MQILFNNVYKTTNIYPMAKMTTAPDKKICLNDNNIVFGATPVIKPVISNKINNEKARLLKKMNEILKTNIPVLDKEQLWEVIERRAMAIIRMKNKKRDSFESELYAIYNSPYLSAQQKYNKLCEIENEEKELDKIDPFEIPDYLIPKPTKENYDYKLIEKFKLALNDNNYDLRSIFYKHYSGLNEISTIEELREKFPSFEAIPSFDEVMSDKIIRTLTRDVYEELNDAVLSEDEDRITQFIYDNLVEKAVTTLVELGLDEPDYTSKFLDTLSKRFARTCALTVKENRLSGVPTISKNFIPEFTEIDKMMSQINYDSFVLHVLKEHYLNGKKLNEITYTEGDVTIKVANLKGSEYKFEKFSENIKNLITGSEKLKQYQRDYLKFTQQELKDRLLYYEKTEFGYDDELFSMFAEFECCKFTEEDKNNLIILLKELDKISDGVKTLEEGKRFLKESNIKPHGTNRINEAEKEAACAQIKAEQLRNQELVALRDDFNIIVNMLYEMGLIAEAEMCMKYYPLNSDAIELAKSRAVVEFISDCINKYDKKVAQAKIARWEAYNEYLENDDKAPEFSAAKKYANDFEQSIKDEKIGQYLVNRNIVEGYPESAKLFSEPELLENIVNQTGKSKDLATLLLCRYEDYKYLPIEEKSSIFDALELFNEDDTFDKIILRYIVENDYMNCDTSIVVERDKKPQRRTIAANAKREVYEKYNFPRSMEFFKKFENALPLDARNENSSGVKKTDKYDKKMEIKYELKIMGHTDRLFATNKNFYFEHYSELGFHR